MLSRYASPVSESIYVLIFKSCKEAELDIPKGGAFAHGLSMAWSVFLSKSLSDSNDVC